MRVRLLAFGLIAMLLGPSYASAAHPRAIMTTSIVNRMRAKVATGTDTYWLALKGAASTTGYSCDRLAQTTAGTSDSLPPAYAPREPITSSPPGYMTSGYQGQDYYTGVLNLAACYYATLDTDPTTAAKYKAQAIKGIQKGSVPFASVAPASPPSTWSSVSVTSRAAYYVSNEGAAGQARVHLTNHGLSAGATVTLSGVLGCTAANITGKVAASPTSTTFDLTDSGGLAVICNAPGTNYNENMAGDAAYPVRFYGTFLALAYDWLYADLSAGDKTNVYNTINAFYDEFRVINNVGSPNYLGNTEVNYHAGFFTAAGMIGILTSGAGENPRGSEIYTYWHDTLYAAQDEPFFQRWLKNNAGLPEAIRYQTLSASGIAMTLLAQWDANSENLFTDATHPYPQTADLMRYWVHNTMPPRTYMSYQGFIAAPTDATGTNPNPWSDLWPAFQIVGEIASRLSDSYRPMFKSWVDTLGGINTPTNSYMWWPVAFWDASLSSTAFTGDALSLPQQSNPAGGYGRVTMRSDWGTSAVLGEIDASPAISDLGNGKERLDKGSLHVQRGDVHLLVQQAAEATRANNSAAYNYMHDRSGTNDERTDYGVYYIKNDATAKIEAQIYCGGAAFGQPGWQDNYPTTVITQNPARIDLYSDGVSYVMSRATKIEKIYHCDSVYGAFYPYGGWDRSVLYLRPKVFVVYDRTSKINKASAPTATYTQYMQWAIGKAPTTSSYGTGMYRSEVSNGGTYKGGLTYVLPTSLSTTTTDLGGYGLVYQVQVSPSAETQYVNWLTVVDAADTTGNLDAVAKFATSSNIDVISLGTDQVVGFTNEQSGSTPTYPLTYTMSGMGSSVAHRIAGVSVSTTYKVSVSGNDVTIATSGAGTDTVSDAAGVLQFSSGAGGNPPVVVSTSSFPSGLIGVAYSQQGAASGGDGGAFTWDTTAGSLPTSLSLSGAGAITGTPSGSPGTSNFTIRACDSLSSCGTKALSIVIAANNPSITTAILPNGVNGSAYSTTVVATAGVTPYTFSKLSGTLPTGLSLSSAGVLSGTPSANGSFTFTVQVSDANAATATQAYTVQVVAAAGIITIATNVGSNTIGVLYGYPGLTADTVCSATLSQGGQTVTTSNSTSGLARRSAQFTGLSPRTTYGITATCAAAAGPVSTTATTTGGDVVSCPASGIQLNVKVAFKPPPGLAGASKVFVEYGYSTVTDSSNTFSSCGSGCVAVIVATSQVANGPLLMRHTWEDVNGVALTPPSLTRTVIVQSDCPQAAE